MAKNIRWQIHFVSIQGVHYRVDIYDEGTFTPVQLTAGPTPFVTDEDASDDFFCPVRTQTGTLQVCTLKPDGNYITLDELLPANNIARPVRLMNLDTTPLPTIEWQGFLSCEAYSQDYTGIPQILDLPLISVLEAMASVQLDQTRSSGLQPVYVCLPAILQEIEIQSGMTCFTYLNYSRTDYRIISKYIDMTVMFEQKEYNNENSTTYIVSGLSAKDALTRICAYMGWIAREKGSELYLQRIGEEIGMYREAIADFPGIAEEESIIEAGIAATFADKWRGTNHQRTVSQGAKSVEVVAKLEKYKLDIELPECPLGNIQQYTETTFNTITSRAGSWGPDTSISSICNKDGSFSNICDFYYYELTDEARIGNQTTIDNVLTCALVNPSASIYGLSYSDGTLSYFYNKYIGAFMAKIKRDDQEYINGLYIVGLRDVYRFNPITSTNHLFSIKSVEHVYFVEGNLKLKCDAITIYSGDTSRVWGDYDGRKSRIRICIKIGDKYWNGTSWDSSFATFLCSENELSIPVNTRLQGEVSIRLYGYMDDWIIPVDQVQGFASDMFIKDLTLDYEPIESETLTDRSENHYFRLLGTNFRDEISIGTDLASTLNNQPSPSLIMNSETEAMTELNYGTDQVPDMRRPELDLLNRLATYYGAARQRLSLIVAHPTDAPLPLLKLQGINDNRVYLPLSESRDWQTNVCKLTCFECPQ